LEIKSEWIYCYRHLGKIKKEECSPGEYRDCKNCPQVVQPSTESTKIKEKPSQRKNRSGKKQASVPPQEEIIEKTFYCRVAHQGIVKERCRPENYSECEGCTQTPVFEEKINPLEQVTLSSIFIENDLLKFEKLLDLPPLSLNLKTISQLNEFKDYIIMAYGTIDAKTKRSEIKNDLELLLKKAKAYLNILGHLSNSSKLILEQELYQQAQQKGINACPFCMENLKKLSVKDHLKQCHPDEVKKIMEAPMDKDLIDQCYSDTNKILVAAHNALKKKKAIPDKGGRPRLTGYKEGIFKLCELFIQNSKKNPSNYYTPGLDEYEGHLFNFVEFFISRISPLHDTSNFSLGQIIKEFKYLPKKSKGSK